MAAARARLPAHEQQTVLVVAPQFVSSLSLGCAVLKSVRTDHAVCWNVNGQFNGLDKTRFEPCQDVALLVWKGNGVSPPSLSQLPRLHTLTSFQPR